MRGRTARSLLVATAVALAAVGCAAPTGGAVGQAKPAKGGAAAKPAPGGSPGPGATTTPAPATGRTVEGLVIGPSAALLARLGADVLAQQAAGFDAARGAALVSHGGADPGGHNGGNVVSNNGGKVVSNNGGNLVSDQGGGLTMKTKYALRQAVSWLARTGGATVELVDAKGVALAPPAKTDAEGRYQLMLARQVDEVAFLRVSYADAGLPIALVATADLAGDAPVQADVTPSTTLVAKKLQALIDQGRVAPARVPVAGARDATDAVAPFMSEQAVVAAGLYGVDAGERVFDAMMAASAPLKEKVAAISTRTGIPFVVGQSNLGDAGPATGTTLALPVAVAYDPRAKGAYAVVDRGQNRIRYVDAAGRITTLAGTGAMGGSGDGGPATKAALRLPTAALYGQDGSLYVADTGNACVRRIRPDGMIETVAGVLGTLGPEPKVDAPPPTFPPEADARLQPLSEPRYLAWDRDEAGLFISDVRSAQVWRLDLARGRLTHVAGSGRMAPSDGLPAADGWLDHPMGIAADLRSTPATLYVAEKLAGTIRRIGPDGLLSTVKVSGPERAVAEARGLAFRDGTLYLADSGGHRVAAIALDAPDAPVRTVAGQAGRSGPGGEAASAVEALLASPEGLAFTPDGRLVVADSGHGLVRETGADGRFRVVAGQLQAVAASADRSRLVMGRPVSLVHDRDGALFVSDAGKGLIVRLAPAPDATVTTFAGREDGKGVSGGDGGPATAATFREVGGLAFDPQGRLVLSDTGEPGSVRRIDRAGVITTIASGFERPSGVVVAADGTVFVAESNGHRITAIAPDGARRVVAGEDGQAGNRIDGDGGPAAQAHMKLPGGLALDAAGDLYVCDLAGTIRKIDLGTPGEPISTVLAGALAGGADAIGAPVSLAFDPQGRLVVSDLVSNQVLRREADGRLTVLAGKDGRAFTGDDVDDGLSQPAGVAFEAGGMWIADSNHNQLKFVPAAALR